MKLEGRIALVTGGATGIGRATVMHMARAGIAGIVINYRSARQQAEDAAAEIAALGVDAECIHADMTDDEQVREMLRLTEERFGRLDVLVNNAGVTHWVPIGDLEGLTDAMWDEILNVNVKGAFRCTRAAAPLLAKTKGAVVNVSSISGVLATPTLSSIAYGTAKAGLIYLTRALAIALAPDVRVNAVAPAFTDTQWMKDHFGDEYDQTIARASSSFPLGRIATTGDVAQAIIGLVTGGDFVTGQTLIVDGGLSLS